MYVRHDESVQFDGQKLKTFIKACPFNGAQLSKYLGHAEAFIAQICTSGRMGRDDWDKLADLLAIKLEDFAPAPEPDKTETADSSDLVKLLASINAHLANCEQYLNNINARSKSMHDDMREWREEVHKDYLELKACWK